LGVPVILGKNGIERIIELDLNDDEKALLRESESAVRDVKNVLDGLSL
jgi:malate dehydrogenase